jgi:hypothetical protein
MLVAPLVAQEIDGTLPPPPVPEGRILDDARLFMLEPQVLKALSQRLTDLSERTGYEMYVAIFDSLIGSDVKEQSRLLQEAWVGDKPGVVLVLESDSSMFELGWSRTPDAVTESGQKVPVLADADLAPQDQVRILNSLAELKTEEKGATATAEKLIKHFADGVDEAFRQAEAAEPERWNVRVLMLGTGLLAAMLLVGFLIGAWLRRSEEKVTERLVFPEVTVGMRLGAQCGGGKISSRSFDVLPREKA